MFTIQLISWVKLCIIKNVRSKVNQTPDNPENFFEPLVVTRFVGKQFLGKGVLYFVQYEFKFQLFSLQQGVATANTIYNWPRHSTE